MKKSNVVITGYYKCIKSKNRVRPQNKDYVEKNKVYIVLERSNKILVFTKKQNLLKISFDHSEFYDYFKLIPNYKEG